MPAHEILPVVDKNDRIRQYLTSGEIHRRELCHREVVIYLVDARGRILVQKRDGGVYDHSVAGHVPKGERYDQTAVRELKEEVGLTVKPKDLLKVGKFYHRTFSDRAQRFNDRFFTLYLLKRPIDPQHLKLDHREVESMVTMTVAQIKRLFQGKQARFKGGFPVSFRALEKFRQWR